MKDYMISVIIPVYNGEGTIGECLESVKNQNAEVIVIDDGSMDNTLSICKEYEASCENIKVYHQENQGVACARKHGIDKANGEYIMFLDSDDCYEENTIGRVIEIIEKYNEPDLIRFRYKKVPNGYDQYEYFPEERLVEKKNFRKDVYPMFINGYMLNAVWSNCAKSEFVKKVYLAEEDMHVGFGEDMLFNLSLFSKINNAVFLKDILYRYVYNENSVTNTKNEKKLYRNLKDSISVFSKLYEYLLEWDMYEIDNIRIIEKRMKDEVDKIFSRLG